MDQNTRLLSLLARLPMSRNDAALLQRGLRQVDDWQELLEQLELHALAPLLLKHAQMHDIELPKHVMLSLKALQMRHILAADACFQVMQELDILLEKQGILFLALKGIALAPLIYHQIEIRPTRDIDLLVASEDLELAAEQLVYLGFKLPAVQPSRFMRDVHQLPNATKEVDGFTVSIELHHDALSRDVPGQLEFEQVWDESQRVVSAALHFQTLGHEHMLHQLCRNLAGHHPGDFIKLVNMLDIVVYAEQFLDEIDWRRVYNEFNHVLNTLRLLHPIVPLSTRLQTMVGNVCDARIQGLGQIMKAPGRIMSKRYSLREKLRLLLNPSDWWLHLHYTVPPGHSLRAVKWFKHPMRVLGWFIMRRYSALRGG